MRLSHFFIGLTFLTACTSNPLDGEYAAFQGTWQWHGTTIQKNAFTKDYLTPIQTRFEASIELDDKGHVTFFQNENIVGEYDFRIVDKKEIASRLEMIIKLKGDIGDLDISDKKLSLSTESDTAFTIDHYPFPAIGEASEYRKEYNAVSSFFVK